MTVIEVHFNHDPDSASADALNLRENGSGSPILAPEWWLGGPSHPAAYARDALTSPLTLKARFSGGPPNGSETVRAIRLADGNPAGPDPAASDHFGGVAARRVQFGFTGESALVEFDMETDSLDVWTVGRTDVTWQWQRQSANGWVAIGVTRHRLFTVLDLPNAPWQLTEATPEQHLQLPWVDALEVACDWAAGAFTVDDAVRRVGLGIHGHPSAIYEAGVGFFGTKSQDFNLTCFLAMCGSDFKLSCRDASNALLTFANLLGADLYPWVLTSSFKTHPVLPLNRDPQVHAHWQFQAWGWHEVVSGYQPADTSQPLDPDAFIHDAVLSVDTDPNRQDQIHHPYRPLPMRFGKPGDRDSYRHHLVANKNGDPVIRRHGRQRVV